MIIDVSEDDIMPFVAECVEKNNLYLAQPVITYLLQNNMKCSARLFSLLLKGKLFSLLHDQQLLSLTSVGYGKLHQLQMIYKTLSTCAFKQVQADSVLFNSALDAFIRCDRAYLAVYLFEHVILSSGNFRILSAPLPYDDIHDITVVVSYFTQFSIRPSVRTFNILMKAMRNPAILNEDPANIFRSCLEIINLMKRYNIEPDTITMNTMIDIAVASGNLDAAEKMISVLDYPPGVEGYTSLIAGYSSKGDISNAFRIFEIMDRNNIEANSFTLSALMNGCIEARNMALATKLLQIGRNRYPHKLSSLYGTYLIGLCKQSCTNRDIEYASSVYSDMLLRNYTLDIATINAYIQALCEVKRDIPAALRVFHYISGSTEPDDYTYSILFSALGKEGHLEDVLRLYHRAHRYMDTPAINSLLRAFLSSDEPLDAVRFFNCLTNSNSTIASDTFIPNKITFTILFASLLKSTKSSGARDDRVDLDAAPFLAYDDSSKRFYETVIFASMKRSRGAQFSASTIKLPQSKYEILKLLFSSMRIKYNIEPDEVMVSTINTLFIHITRGPNSIISFKGTRKTCD